MGGIMKYIVLIIALCLGLSACGTTTYDSEPAASEPIISTPTFTDDELQTMADIERLLPDLKHIYATELKCMDNVDIDEATHFANDWVVFRKDWNSSGTGELIGGRVAHLEDLFERAGRQVQLFGLGLAKCFVPGELTDAEAEKAAQNAFDAEQTIKDTQLELDSLQAEFQ